MTVTRIKTAVRERDGFCCTRCGMTDAQHRQRYGKTLDVHRVTPGSRYTVQGCITVCRSCHGPLPRRKRGTPDLENKRKDRPLNFWVGDDLAATMSAYLDSQRPRPTTTSVVEVALEDFLRLKGFWPAAE